MKIFNVKYVENKQNKEILCDCADLETCKTWVNQWRVHNFKQKKKILIKSIDFVMESFI
jgi:hypothetical protein